MLTNIIIFLAGFFVCAYCYNNSGLRTGLHKLISKFIATMKENAKKKKDNQPPQS